MTKELLARAKAAGLYRREYNGEVGAGWCLGSIHGPAEVWQAADGDWVHDGPAFWHDDEAIVLTSWLDENGC